MHKGRLEAFTDAVIAIIMTVMVLELKAPHSADLGAIRAQAPDFLTYILSFVFLGIYWNNHHHMFQSAKHVGGAVLWANLHLLFWLSLIPFATAWMGEQDFKSGPVAAYGIVLFACSIAYFILAKCLVAVNGKDSDVARGLGRDVKGKLSSLIYLIAIGLAFVWPPLAGGLYLVVALVWLVPDRRFERDVD
jgi:uncharacterized membrane protein